MPSPSARIVRLVDGLPLRAGMRVLEIGCGPGVAARLVCGRVGARGFVLAIDRSAKAVSLARAGSVEAIAAGRLEVRCCAIEDLALARGEARFDLAFAFRVGALDGRHPELETQARGRLAAALKPSGRIFIDAGDELRELRG